MYQIKIANIIEEGRYGGPQTRIVGVAERLKAQDIETVIVLPEKESERFYAEAVKRKLAIRSLKMHKLSRSPIAILFYFLTFPKEVYLLCKILKKENIDIVHCNSARQFKGVVAGCLARKKVIWHLQDTWNPLIIRAFFFTASFLVDHFIAAGEKVREYYLGRFPLSRKPVKIIQAPVDTSVFDPDLVYADQRIASSPGVKVVSVGNINPAKGYEYFIDAVSHISKRNIPGNFWVVGPHYENQKTYYEKLQSTSQKITHNSFQFYGASDNIRSVLKAADVYVCSSIYEASPISVWEAMSMGKAVISTDVGDVRQFIQDGVNGFIVPLRDPKALADKIGVLLQDANLRQVFGARARTTAIRHLDISICARKHAEAYRDILKK